MAKNIINRIDRNLARRLAEARREAGLSTRAVADKLPRRLAVSHTTIAGYEKGTCVPPVTVLAALASLYQRTLNWFLENRRGLSEFRYRNLKSRSRLSDKRQFEALAGKWTDAYINIESRLKAPLRRAIAEPGDLWDAGPKQFAQSIRKSLGLDDSQPIQNTIALLEMYAIRALELRTPLEFEGVAAKHDNLPVVIFNPEMNNDRVRLVATLELAHVLYAGAKEQFRWSHDFVERQAYDFATSLLLPDSQLELAFSDRSFIRLIEFRERFGISLAAMIYRAEKSKIIKSTTARWLWSEMAARGWRKSEPGFVWRDRAVRFEMLMEGAIHSRTLTWASAEEVTGICADELRNRVASAVEYGRAGLGEEKGDEDEVRILRFTPGFDGPSSAAE